MKKRTPLIAMALALAVPSLESIASENSDLDELRQQLEQMKNDYERRIRALEQRLKAAETAAEAAQSAAKKAETLQREVAAKPVAPAETPADALDQAVAASEPVEQPAPPAPATRDLWSQRFGATNVRLLDIGLVTNVVAGWSSEPNDIIELLHGGEHDPKRRGFTLQQSELALKGAVDPYFTGEAYFLFSEEGAELEEAFFTTTSLPYDLQLEGGFFLTEFGRKNPTHLDQWHWIDQPVINTRLFGGEGSRAAGFRLSALLPTTWYSEFHFGMQDPTNEAMASFKGNPPGEGHAHGEEEDGGEEGLGGFAIVGQDKISNLSDMLYLGRWVNGVDIDPTLSAQLGLSVLHGPNTTGSDGETWIYGADLVAKWRPTNNFRGWPFVLWETEIINRDYDVDKRNANFVLGETDDTLHDWGLYTELLYGFKHPWATGVRFEYASGSGNGEEPRDEDPFRSDRYRVSPLLVYHFSEFSRLRLQYNYDHADFLKAQDRDRDVHSLWLGFEYTLGSHPPHKY